MNGGLSVPGCHPIRLTISDDDVRPSIRVAVLSLALFTACGGGAASPPSAVSPTTRDPSPSEATSLTAPTTTRPADNQPIQHWSFEATFKDGIVLDISVDQFKAGRAGEIEDSFGEPVPTGYGGSFRGGCPNMNPERDLIVPIRLGVRNATPGFATNLYVKLGFGDASGRRTEVFSGTSDGLCTVQADAVNLRSGGEVSTFGYAIVRGFRTPAAPEGDTEITQSIRMGLVIQTPFAGLDHVSRQAGPQADDCTAYYSSSARTSVCR